MLLISKYVEHSSWSFIARVEEKSEVALGGRNNNPYATVVLQGVNNDYGRIKAVCFEESIEPLFNHLEVVF